MNTSVPVSRPVRATRLSVIGRLIERLHDEGIRYCHWKSNDTLDESLDGLIDLDLLVDASAAGVLPGLLAAARFKPMVSAPWCAYPAISHFFALDRATGQLAHLHVYYRLITGEGHLKAYHLPWEDSVLATRRLDAERGVYVADPHLEMVVFLVRSALKLRTYEWVCRSGAVPCFRGRSLAEFRWLQKRTAPLRVVEVGHELLRDEAGQRLRELLESQPTLRRLRAFRRSVIAALHVYRRYGPVEAVWHKWLKEWCSVWSRTRLRHLLPPAPFTRIPTTGGRLIAFTGADGSGKSTLAKEITAWLSQRIDVLFIYLGSGSGPVSPIRWPLQLASRLLRRRRRALSAGPPPAWVTIARAVWALSIS